MIIPPSGGGGSLAIGSTVTGATTGLLKVTSGVLGQGTAAVDYVSPTGSGAGLTGLTASQVGSVPAGILKGSGGAFTAATANTDFLLPSGSGASLTGITASQIGSVPAGVLKGAAGAFAAATAGTDYAGIGSTNTFTGSNTFNLDLTIANGNNLMFAGGGYVRTNGVTNVANTGAYYLFSANTALISQRHATASVLNLVGASGGSGLFLECNGDSGTVLYVDSGGRLWAKGFQGPFLADAAVANNTIFLGSAHGNAPCWKDGSGTVHTFNLTP